MMPTPFKVCDSMRSRSLTFAESENSDDRNVDLRKNVLRRLPKRCEARNQNGNGHHRKGVGPAQGELNNPHRSVGFRVQFAAGFGKSFTRRAQALFVVNVGVCWNFCSSLSSNTRFQGTKG